MTTVIEITADSSEGEAYYRKGMHLHMLQVFVYGWRDEGFGPSFPIQWLTEADWPATVARDTAIVFASSADGSYLIDEKATQANLLAAFPDAEIRWTVADEPSEETIERSTVDEPPFLIDLCEKRECSDPDCILVGGRPATDRLRRRDDHEWRRAGNGRTLAERYVEKIREDRILAREDALDPSNHSLNAEQLREVAASIRDHRESAANRAKWLARQNARS
jgi:hypothetical protein